MVFSIGYLRLVSGVCLADVGNGVMMWRAAG